MKLRLWAGQPPKNKEPSNNRARWANVLHYVSEMPQPFVISRWLPASGLTRGFEALVGRQIRFGPLPFMVGQSCRDSFSPAGMGWPQDRQTGRFLAGIGETKPLCSRRDGWALTVTGESHDRRLGQTAVASLNPNLLLNYHSCSDRWRSAPS